MLACAIITPLSFAGACFHETWHTYERVRTSCSSKLVSLSQMGWSVVLLLSYYSAKATVWEWIVERDGWEMLISGLIVCLGHVFFSPCFPEMCCFLARAQGDL